MSCGGYVSPVLTLQRLADWTQLKTHQSPMTSGAPLRLQGSQEHRARTAGDRAKQLLSYLPLFAVGVFIDSYVGEMVEVQEHLQNV